MMKLFSTCNHLFLPAMGVLGLFLLTAQPAAAADDTTADLHRQVRERNTQLLEERTRVLRANPEAVRIRRQIEALYRELDSIVTHDPTVKKILLEREALRDRLASKNRAGKKPKNNPVKPTTRE